MADEDFHKQLELETLEKQKKELGDWSVPNSTYVDPSDGTVYEWDSVKQAYFPKIDDDILASYQAANYEYKGEETSGTQSAVSSQQSNSGVQEELEKKEKRKANSEPSWFEVDEAHNTNVYVSGLPMDTTEEQFIELMSKCGLIMKDPDTMKYKIKLYRNADGTLKGDGRCCYIKVESVGLALDILDGYLYKGNHQIHVERAQFELKGAYDPSKKPRKKRVRDKEKLKKKLDKLFDWRPDKLRGQRLKHERTVIIKNMFDPKDFEADASLILEYQTDVREECSAKCGEVKKVVVYDRHPEGVVSVTFAEPEMADECINLMHGRWFASRQLTAETWDGKTRYKVVETEEERQKRLQQWDKFLEGGNKADSSSGVAVASDPNSVVSDKVSEPVQVPPKSAYELAGETDSSGESGDENEQSVPRSCSSSSSLGPVMTSQGVLEFSPEPNKHASSISNGSDQ